MSELNVTASVSYVNSSSLKIHLEHEINLFWNGGHMEVERKFETI